MKNALLAALAAGTFLVAAAIFVTGSEAPESDAAAFDIAALSDEDQLALRDQIRAYLLDNPEVIFEAVDVAESRQAEAQASQDDTLVQVNAEAIFDDGFSWVGGNPEGDITMVEFVDYRCGYCRRAHEDVAKLIQEDGNIRIIVKEFPILGQDSMVSAQFAVAVKQLGGSEAYKAAHDALITMRSVSEVSLSRLATTLGLDATQVLAHMGTPEVMSEIQETRALAQRLQITGTPTFVMQGELLRGYVPYDAMKQIVAELRR